MFLRTFGWSFGITVLALAAAGFAWGPTGFGIVLILAVLEISLSFDNAVVNATVLRRMSPFWQKLFLTVGVLIAVFGMRLLFPLAVVGITARITPSAAVELAMDPSRTYHGRDYAQHLAAAHPAIAAFGGMFLLMIFLNFLFEENDTRWWPWLERSLQRIGSKGRSNGLLPPVAIALAALLLVVWLFQRDGSGTGTVALAGVAGVVTHLVVDGVSGWFESSGADEEGGVPEDARPPGAGTAGRVSGRAAFFLFVYLEVLDATFSFDGVVGAFAVSREVLQIALGLGVGAMFIRSLTVYLVRQGTLDDYVYLEHGAHYAIGALAVILLLTIRYEVPEIVTGLIGVCFIGAAMWSSIRRNRRLAAASRAPTAAENDEVPSDA